MVQSGSCSDDISGTHRKSHAERAKEIAQAAIKVISQKGFYGSSLQEVADEVGITTAGLLRHVKSKNGLLLLVLDEFERTNSVTQVTAKLEQQFRETGEAQFFPLIYRTSVKQALGNPKLTQLYLVLRAEAMDESHPAHEYYVHRGLHGRKQIANIRWNVPERYQDPEKMVNLYMTMGSALDGLQMRWIGEPNFDLPARWADCEHYFYTLPEWRGMC